MPGGGKILFRLYVTPCPTRTGNAKGSEGGRGLENLWLGGKGNATEGEPLDTASPACRPTGTYL